MFQMNKKPILRGSDYNTITKAEQQSKLDNRFADEEPKTKKEIWVLVGLSFGGTLYASQLLFNFIALVFKNLSLDKLFNRLSLGESPKTIPEKNVVQIHFFDIVKFIFGWGQPLSWLLGLIVAGMVYYYINGNNIRINNMASIRNNVIDPNSKVAGDLETLLDDEDVLSIAPDAKVTFDADVTSLQYHIMIKNNTAQGLDNSITFDTKSQNQMFDLQLITNNLTRKKTENGITKNVSARTIFDARKFKYNHKDDAGHWVRGFGKQPVKTVADVINTTWFTKAVDGVLGQEQPLLGAYIITTNPSNAIIIGGTRSGKGQKAIEILIDLWSRQKKQPNIILTDPKNELLKLCARTLVLRGYLVKTINTSTPDISDIYNLYSYPTLNTYRGDYSSASNVLDQLSNVLFESTGENDYWYKTAARLVRLIILALIDLALIDVERIKLDTRLPYNRKEDLIDERFSQVSAVNTVSFLNQLYSVELKLANPEHKKLLDAAGYAEDRSAMFVLFEILVQKMPATDLRRGLKAGFELLKSQTGNERGFASVLSITHQVMSFFTEPAITKVTSGRPSKSFDFLSLGYPRRLAIWFDSNYLIKRVPNGRLSVKWTAYIDPECKKPLLNQHGEYVDITDISDYKTKFGNYSGTPQQHQFIEKQLKTRSKFIESIYNRGNQVIIELSTLETLYIDVKGNDMTYTSQSDVQNSWSVALFETPFPNQKTYFKLELFDINQNILDSFYLEFTKGYRTNATDTAYYRNPSTGKYIITDGTVQEYNYVDGHVVHQSQTFSTSRKSLEENDPEDKIVKFTYPIIRQSYAKYSESPTALFLATPPQQASYNRIAILVINAAFNDQFGFFTLYGDVHLKTKYLLDEFGNIQSEGKGIPEMDQKLSIGLGAGQEFTIVVQALTQIDSLYTQSIRDIILANIKNWCYLQSTSEDVINYISGLSGEVKTLVQSGVNRNIASGVGHSVRRMRPTDSIAISEQAETQNAITPNMLKKIGSNFVKGEAVTIFGSSVAVVEHAFALPVAFKLLPGRTGGYNSNVPLMNLPIPADNAGRDTSKDIPNFMNQLFQLYDLSVEIGKVDGRFRQQHNLSDIADISVELDSNGRKLVNSDNDYNDMITQQALKNLGLGIVDDIDDPSQLFTSNEANDMLNNPKIIKKELNNLSKSDELLSKETNHYIRKERKALIKITPYLSFIKHITNENLAEAGETIIKSDVDTYVEKNLKARESAETQNKLINRDVARQNLEPSQELLNIETSAKMLSDHLTKKQFLNNTYSLKDMLLYAKLNNLDDLSNPLNNAIVDAFSQDSVQSELEYYDFTFINQNNQFMVKRNDVTIINNGTTTRNLYEQLQLFASDLELQNNVNEINQSILNNFRSCPSWTSLGWHEFDNAVYDSLAATSTITPVKPSDFEDDDTYY